MKKIQSPAVGLQLAQLLGIKGDLPLDLDQVASPVVVLDQLTRAPLDRIRETIQVATGVGPSKVQIRPSVPIYIYSVDFTLDVSRGVEFHLQVSGSSPVWLTFQGSAVNLGDPTHPAVGNILYGDSAAGGPPGTRFYETFVSGAAGPNTVSFERNPVPLGPLRDASNPNLMYVSCTSTALLWVNVEYARIPTPTEPFA